MILEQTVFSVSSEDLGNYESLKVNFTISKEFATWGDDFYHVLVSMEEYEGRACVSTTEVYSKRFDDVFLAYIDGERRYGKTCVHIWLIGKEKWTRINMSDEPIAKNAIQAYLKGYDN